MAVTICQLGINIEFRTISALFGLGRSTVGEIVIDTCDVISSKLLIKYVKIPQREKLQEFINGFKHRWDFPQTVGPIDGTHIHILKPEESSSDHYNQKGYYSIVKQA